MSLLISVVVAVIVIFGLGYIAPQLPFNELLGGSFYQVVGIVLAILISVVLNLPMLFMFKGNSAYKKGQFKEALEMYKKAVKTKRLSPDMEIYCGYIHLKEGDKETAEKMLDAVEKKNLSDRQRNSLDTNRAILLWKQGRIDEGIELMSAVWERAQAVTVAGSLGALMLVKARETGDYSRALKFCEETNEQFTYERTILANLGEAYYSVGRNDDALRVFGELMDCGCVSPAPYYYYALALIKAERKTEAKEMLDRALRMRFTHISTVARKTVKEKADELTNED